MYSQPERKQSMGMLAKAAKSPSRSTLSIFLLGLLVGLLFPRNLSVKPSVTSMPHGVLLHLSDIPFRPTSHVDDHGQAIMKQQFIEPFAIPRMTGFSVATFRPGQTVKSHAHENMVEIFYVLSGTGYVKIDEKVTSLTTGHFFAVVPGESHSLWVDESETQDMQVALYGVIVE